MVLIPDAAQVEQLRAMDPEQGPLQMINMLRYREQADYAAHPQQPACSGREAYQRYSEGVVPILNSLKGTLFWMASVELNFIAPPEERWDDVLVVRYPSLAAFQQLLSHPDYAGISFHRDAALQDSRLIITRNQFLDTSQDC